ncbi:cytochrome P450 for pimelic acid formation for biotin biosynthesis [Mycolicibacterium phlei RIVM601174]|jgi:cytochrome P450|nr:cytochrome P450 for pimelic acid formation for biotin biosynthesis [Mycolicibacterium phlei RIVM601174]MBF4190613.1 cytochrome P450 for pimelic acid formation for biotin biosynthesis [Mycolicibacterium phlei]
MVLPLLASANRDPDAFTAPDVFDITRTPNHHIAFSKGAHYCLGASLARMELRVALGSLFARLPDTRMAIDPAELRYQPLLFWRRLESLPVVPG